MPSPDELRFNAKSIADQIAQTAPPDTAAVILLFDRNTNATAFASTVGQDRDRLRAILKELLHRLGDSPIITLNG